MKDMEQLRRAAVRAGLMGMNGTSVAMHKLEAFASILLDEENEACARAAEEFGPARPIVTDRPSERVMGRWEGEQAASGSIASQIRERRKA